MSIRFEFIGIQNNEDVYGHKFIKSIQELEDWLKEQRITEYYFAPCGFLPDNYVVSFRMAKLFLGKEHYVKSGTKIGLLHAFNELCLSDYDLEDLPEEEQEDFYNTVSGSGG